MISEAEYNEAYGKLTEAEDALKRSLKTVDFALIDLGKQFDSYSEYENFIHQLVESSELEIKPLYCKKGQALIWAANLIHGGDIIRDPNSTRYSHVTHYYYEGCDVYYSPMFSESWKGNFSKKNILDKNIKNHKF